jgi:hypothetical protein
MNRSLEAWLVRLPDGRVVRAKSADSVRHHVERGRIPPDAWVRRAGDEEWQALEWTSEFGDLAKRRPDAPAARPTGAAAPRGNGASAAPSSGAHAAVRGSHELQVVGVRGLVDELLGALDSTLLRPKLLLAGVLGLCAGALLVLAPRLPELAAIPSSVWPWAAAGLVLLILAGFCAALLTQMTFVELSRLRPARRREATHRLGSNALGIIVCQLVVAGLTVLLIAGLRALPDWLSAEPGSFAAQTLAGFAVALGLVLEVLLWPVLGLALLLAPIVVVEDCGIATALGQWCGLLRRHAGRVLVYEAFALALGVVAVLPLLLPVLIAAYVAPGAILPDIQWATLSVLGSLALSPLFAYLVVANVYIFLNLRYEFSAGK